MAKKRRSKRRSDEAVNNYVGQRLRELRLERGLTCKQMAEQAGITPGSYSCLENGWFRISLDNLFRMLQALGVQVAQVWPPLNGGDGEGKGREAVEAVVQQVAERGQPPAPTMRGVLEAVCQAFKVSQRQMASGARWSRLDEARGACGILVGEAPGLSLQDLSRQLNLSRHALNRLIRRHREQAEQDGHLSARIAKARRVLEAGDG